MPQIHLLSKNPGGKLEGLSNFKALAELLSIVIFVYSLDTINVNEVSSGGSGDIRSISKKDWKGYRPWKFWVKIWSDCNKIKLGVDIPQVHIFDIIISPNLCWNVIIY